MPISIDGPKRDDLCRGGPSFMCKKTSETADPESRILAPHERKLGVWCRNCDRYMGCAVCAHPIQELICEVCRDWATDAGERKHGRMVRDTAHAAALMRAEIDKLVEKFSIASAKASAERPAAPEPEPEPEYWADFQAAMVKQRAAKKGAA